MDGWNKSHIGGGGGGYMDSENVRAREGERSREKTRKRVEIERRERGERWESESSSEEGSAERAKERSTPDCSNGHQISEMNLRTHNRHASFRIFLPSHISLHMQLCIPSRTF